MVAILIISVLQIRAPALVLEAAVGGGSYDQDSSLNLMFPF